MPPRRWGRELVGPWLPGRGGATGGAADGALSAAIGKSLGIKQNGHDFDVRKPAPGVGRFMSLTGG